MPYTNAHAFVQALFGEFSTKALFASEPFKLKDWTRQLKKLDETQGCYFSSGAFPEDHPENVAHKAELCLGLAVLGIDDVGTARKSLIPAEVVELGLGRATAVINSSPDNYQWLYRLSRLVTHAEKDRFFAGVRALLGGKPPNEQSIQQLFRVPMGVNTKPEFAGFKVQCVELDPEIELDVEWVLSNAPLGEPRSSTEEIPQVHDIKTLVALVPNPDLDYDEWIAMGQRIKALSPGADGLEAFIELSSRSSKNNVKYDTEAKWHTLHPDRTHGGLLLGTARAAAPEKFTRWEAREVFDDGEVEPEPPKPKPAKPVFKWIDHKLMPTRDWLYGRLLIRKFLTMTIAPGGRGKSSLIVAEALAQATGKNLIGEKPRRALNVWMWNLEDPQEEVQRRVLAAAKHHKVSEADLGDRLLVSGGRDERLVIADMIGNKPVILQKAVDELIARILEYGIDILIIDPFVSCHKVPENDNIAQDMVIKTLNRVAEEGNCAVHIVDHVRKGPSETEIDTQSARGAKAKTDAARVVRVINRMTDLEGKNIYGKSEPWKYIHVFHDKANMAPPRARREWFQLLSVSLENGGVQPGVGAGINADDEVGVIDEWSPPNAGDMANSDNLQRIAEKMKTDGKRYRRDSRSPDWIGKVIATIIDPEGKLSSKQITDVLEVYLKEKLLKSVVETDAKRRPKEFIVLAEQF